MHRWYATQVYERTRRELGSWPSPQSLVDDLAATFGAAADTEQQAEQKNRLRAIADGLAGFAREVVVAVLSTKIGTVT